MNQANTDKTTYNKTISNMKIGVCEMQGWRKTMEDAAIVLPNFEKNTSLFGILDGHGGSIISEFVSVNFKNILIKTKSYKNGEYEQALVQTFIIIDELLKDRNINNWIVNTHNNSSQNSEEKKNFMRSHTAMINGENNFVILRFETGIYEYDLNELNLKSKIDDEAFTTIYKFKGKNGLNFYEDESSSSINDIKEMNLDEIFFKKGGKQNAALNKLPSFDEVFYEDTLNIKFEDNNENILNRDKNEEINKNNFISNEMGTTANIMLIKNNKIYIANVGDSLSIMYKNKKAYNLNREHQIVIKEERDRVLKSGANIVGYRINGMLNLTRAIGDLIFKKNKEKKIHEQSVISIPEITVIEETEDIDFIIMGCDGVWDCVKRQNVCEFIYKEIKENPKKKLSDILEVIFDKCVSKASGVVLGTDNMSCIIIQFLNQKDKSDFIAKKINYCEGVVSVENIDNLETDDCNIEKDKENEVSN